jgi:hypothetical protein
MAPLPSCTGFGKLVTWTAMKGYSSFSRAKALFLLAILQLAVGWPLTTSLLLRPVSVLGAIAMSGSFYAQKFEIPAGGTVRGSSIYVTAFNNGVEPITFVMGYTAPPNVALEFSDNVFVLNGEQSKEVLVAVHVGADAVPGMYDIAVNLKAQRDTAEGIQVLGAAEQVAPLTVSEQSGIIHVKSVSPSGDSIRAHVRLWKVISGNEYEFADTQDGVLDAVVSPGSYVVRAFSMGVEFASRRFSVANQERKSINMTVETVYFKSFRVVLEDADTEGPEDAQVLYTLANAYRPISDASVHLVVMLDGAHVETVPAILTANTLDIGEEDESYSYVPAAGWEEGTYSYRLELSLGGELYASTRNVTPGGDTAQRGWLWVVWVVLGVLCVAGLGSLAFFVWRRRRNRR